ncbi:hypothetical protein ACFOY4_24310 [Actinomadura syzygii]|uniref:YbaB/EbfC family nucleoid-associated protein n=1 Tax=Actinomadura syzygii TaxID=1427538 RepID=A0A5D0UMT7_9ACTN|nr:YbaB/EbfC family nucleoid-associated protein [Actinomadura syzygii]TYC18449.1 hypothetical protein FXF65_01415 [Actinomadura syzygii]
MTTRRNSLKKQLNEEAPLAPKDQYEARERLRAGTIRAEPEEQDAASQDAPTSQDLDTSGLALPGISPIPIPIPASPSPSVDKPVDAEWLDMGMGSNPPAPMPQPDDSAETGDDAANAADVEEFETHMEDLRSRADSMYGELVEKRISYTDPTDTITVTADGFGEIIDIQFAVDRALDARQINLALTRSLSEMKALAEAALPDMAGAFNLPTEASVLQRLDDISVDAYVDLDDARSQLIEQHAMETLVKIRDLKPAQENRTIEERIGRGLGNLKMTVAGDPVQVEIKKEAIRDVTLERLAEAILAALGSAGERTAEIREAEVREIQRRYGRLMY